LRRATDGRAEEKRPDFELIDRLNLRCKPAGRKALIEGRGKGQRRPTADASNKKSAGPTEALGRTESGFEPTFTASATALLHLREANWSILLALDAADIGVQI